MEYEYAHCLLCPIQHHVEHVAAGWDFEYETTHDEYSYVQCSGCGLVYLYNRPQPRFDAIIYPSHYYSATDSEQHSYVVRTVREFLELRKVINLNRIIGTDANAIFDVGCGDGRLLDVFKQKNKSDSEFYGIELIGDAACRARAKGYTVYEGNIETADLSSLSGKMDLVLMHQIIEHTRSPRAVIKKINGLLRQGGILSIETPDVDSLDFKLFRKRYWGGYHIPRHFYLFTKPTLCRLLKEEGFDIVSVASILSPVFWVTSLHNICKERFSKSTAHFFSYKNPLLLAMATLIDMVQIVFFSRSSNMQIVARKRKNA